MSNLLTVSRPSQRRDAFPLTCRITPTARTLDLNDLIGIVCKRGPDYGEIGRVLNYQSGRVTLTFADQERKLFTGPSLDNLGEPSLNTYEVEPFYIGDINQNKGLSSSPNRSGVYDFMKLIGRTHAGLLRLSDQMKHGRPQCALRVQSLLKSDSKTDLDGTGQ